MEIFYRLEILKEYKDDLTIDRYRILQINILLTHIVYLNFYFTFYSKKKNLQIFQDISQIIFNYIFAKLIFIHIQLIGNYYTINR